MQKQKNPNEYPIVIHTKTLENAEAIVSILNKYNLTASIHPTICHVGKLYGYQVTTPARV